MNKQSLNRPYTPAQPYYQNQQRGRRKNIANTGVAFENLIVYANSYYELRKIAFIQKLEQPVRIQRKYPNGVVTGTLKKSTVDYLGSLSNGRMIAFDAKSTVNKTSFPLSQIEEHQYEYLSKYHEMNAVSFILLEWVTSREYFIISFSTLEKYWERAKTSNVKGSKSIPYKDFINHPDLFFQVHTGEDGMPLHYLKPFIL